MPRATAPSARLSFIPNERWRLPQLSTSARTHPSSRATASFLATEMVFALVPISELDCARVLAPGAVLREQARPVTRVAQHLGAALLLLRRDLVGRPHRLHGPYAFPDEPGPGVGAHDTELPDSFSRVPARRNATVTQVKTK